MAKKVKIFLPDLLVKVAEAAGHLGPYLEDLSCHITIEDDLPEISTLKVEIKGYIPEGPHE